MRRYKISLLLAPVVLASTLLHAAAETNSLVWNPANDRVSADVRGEALWPLLEDIAHQTGWRIFVEPETARNVDVKFSDLPSGDALHKLLGDLNFAFVPQTNGPSQLYIFKTRQENATLRVPAAPVAKAGPQKHVPNQLLLKLKPGADIDAIAKLYGANVIGRDDKLGIYLLEFPDAAAADAALAQLKNNSDVAAVDYNYIFDPLPMPQQIANPPSGPVKLTLNPPTTPNDPCNPVVGLIDTRMQSLGSELDPFILKPISVVGDAATTPAGSTQAQSTGSAVALFSPQQVSGTASTLPTHGTAMAETILRAVSQVAGGSSSVRILPVQVFDSNEQASTWSVALGVQAAVDNGATVLNMSLGGTTDSPILDDVIQQALAHGVVIFAAAGNQPVNTPTYPAALSGVNAVTALGAPGQLASYANYGSFVEMALPGASVVYLGSQAYVVQGTSPATAYATGVAVGTKGINCLTWTQIESAMHQKFPVPQN
ncbi:MAG TPA: S8 family serine peptidase [Verrucomicrobiae bacterium]